MEERRKLGRKREKGGKTRLKKKAKSSERRKDF